MRIVIEGVNGSGKSMLTVKIAHEFKLPFVHAGPKPVGDYAAERDCCKQAEYTDCVMDRITPISWLCYQLENSKLHTILLQSFLSDMMENTIFIHTVGRGENIDKPYYTDEHREEIVNNHEIIRGNYVELFKTIPHFEYDFEKHTLEEVIQYVNSRNKLLSMI